MRTLNRPRRNHVFVLLACTQLLPIAAWGAEPPRASSPGVAVPPDVAAMLASLKPADLKGDLSFLASDTLAGRFTPSPGLDAAAEFIASEFRAASLEPAGDRDYFQTTSMVDRRLPPLTSGLMISLGSRDISVPPSSMVLLDTAAAAKIERAPLLSFAARDLDAFQKANVTGKVIVVRGIDFAKLPKSKAGEAYHRMIVFDRAVATSSAALEIIVENSGPRPTPSRLLTRERAGEHIVPAIRVDSAELRDWLDRSGGEPQEAQTATLHLPGPEDQEVPLRNVVGILRGSDPVLKKTCVMLTAHYDHIGTSATAGPYTASPAGSSSGDQIFNGANDDGSGTVSVVEIAKALARLPTRPKRSILFVTFFGEERGELGSKFYGSHPVFPLADTVADVNLEQVGRTDSTTGKQINTASLTGYDYSEVTRFLEQAGRSTGIRVYKDPEASDAYFALSDNAALAEKGVPAHSITVAFDYPDYHGLGDEWQKIDYDNMARVDRMITLAVLNLANSPRAPRWNSENPKTEPFRAARQKPAAE